MHKYSNITNSKNTTIYSTPRQPKEDDLDGGILDFGFIPIFF